MRKWIYKMILAFVPFWMFFGMEISTNAMTQEEKELLDKLKVEYRVDENGDFKDFVVSETDSRFPNEVLIELAKEYPGKDGYSRIGKYTVFGKTNNEGTLAEFYIIDEETGINIFWGHPNFTMYHDNQNNFHFFSYNMIFLSFLL